MAGETVAPGEGFDLELTFEPRISDFTRVPLAEVVVLGEVESSPTDDNVIRSDAGSSGS